MTTTNTTEMAETTEPTTEAVETTTATTAETEAPAQPEPVAEPDVETEAEAPESGRPEREAAKYRRQLREVEAERDGLRATLAALQTSYVEQVLKSPIRFPDTPLEGGGRRRGNVIELRNPTDLATIGGVEHADLFTDGLLDQDKLFEAVGALYEARPELFKFHHQPIPSIGRDTADHNALRRGSGDWAGALRDIL